MKNIWKVILLPQKVILLQLHITGEKSNLVILLFT